MLAGGCDPLALQDAHTFDFELVKLCLFQTQTSRENRDAARGTRKCPKCRYRKPFLTLLVKRHRGSPVPELCPVPCKTGTEDFTVGPLFAPFRNEEALGAEFRADERGAKVP